MSVTSKLRDIDSVSAGLGSEREQEDVAQLLQRIERLGKHLFGVAICALQLDEPLCARLGWQCQDEVVRFHAAQVSADTLRILPDKSSPFQPPLGRVGQLDVRFYLAHPVRTKLGEIAGSLLLLHDRPRAFTNGDRELLADVLALIAHQLRCVSS
ncbi:GAF domain-containing protein [uncultured Oxalicibacterium sp.]|uniref:GAF domain-containing protein n=1 Tax=uncultured Oxalicibacterium sp. TaxID=1168540 RepID=UPI0025CEA1D1|nr:GAF domain-containing protein [uncultured Oxalicibacterium sp.]